MSARDAETNSTIFAASGQPLFCAEDVRHLDSLAIEEYGIPGIQLMKRAGRACFELLRQRWPEVKELTIYCGAGNNAGDGYVIAGLAAVRGYQVRAVSVVDPQQLKGDARLAYDYAVGEGVLCVPFSTELALSAGLVVDALLGTGLQSAPRDQFAQAIAHINRSGLPVLAVDLPSGLDANTGATPGAVVRADVSMTFIGYKRGLLTGRGPAVVGELHFSDLGVPALIYDTVVAACRCLDLSSLMQALPPREADAHKGLFGHVMIIGGDLGMGGAAIMAAEAAARVGAGMVSVATRPDHLAGVLARCPEVMVNGVASGQALEPLLERPSVIVVGPGLGQSPWSEQLLQQALMSGKPLVIDADGLNILARSRMRLPESDARWILTPHPGEAARLLGCATEEVQADRFAAVKALQKRFGGVVILKGAGSLIDAGAAEVSLCSSGNPGMATAGMGDVLAGIIGGLLAQNLPALTAAQLGVCVHGAAGDLAAAKGQRGLLPSDLMVYLRAIINAMV